MAKKTTTPKKNYDAQFKAEVAIAALSGTVTTDGIARQFKVNKTQVNSWRNILKQNAPQLFTRGKQNVFVDHTEQIDELKRMIGELTMENNLLKKKLY
ncbi:transposase [Chitinophaga oryzae]|uniref:Transposase n=1 Tax=Chitinophaga oryzae TaxID=2725414 RepID=A0AAE6ZPI3_9BACT|nr:transposase [Chitinophaga oryzae]QJB35923.1 transposase [Chitinophaga oryzae]